MKTIIKPIIKCIVKSHIFTQFPWLIPAASRGVEVLELWQHPTEELDAAEAELFFAPLALVMGYPAW